MESPRPVPSPAGLVVKKGLNIRFFIPGGNSGSVVDNVYPPVVAVIFCIRRKGRLIGTVCDLVFTFGRRIETIRDQVEKYSRDFLREQVDFASSGVKRA